MAYEGSPKDFVLIMENCQQSKEYKNQYKGMTCIKTHYIHPDFIGYWASRHRIEIPKGFSEEVARIYNERNDK